MNRCWTQPLVKTSVGGGAGGGAQLTPFGEQVLRAYRVLEDQLMQCASDGPFHRFESDLLASPRPQEPDEGEKSAHGAA